MKVALFAPKPGGSGIAGYVQDLTNALRDQTEVFTHTLTSADPGSLRDLAARADETDVVHIQHDHSGFGGIAHGQPGFWTLRYAIQRPFVITAHDTRSASELVRPLQGGPLRRLWLAARLRSRAFADSLDIAPFVTGRCITLTEADRQILIGRGAQSRYVHTIPAGAPQPVVGSSEAGGFRERHGLQGLRVVLQPLDGEAHLTTLQTLDDLPPDVVVVFASLASRAGSPPAKTAHLLSHRRAKVIADLPAGEFSTALASAEVVLAGGDTTGGPRDVLEALSVGTPVLAPDLPAFREIQERVPCLRLVRTGDAGHLAACLKAVLGNPVGRAEMRERGLRYAEQFSWRRIAELTMEVYREAIADDAVPVSR